MIKKNLKNLPFRSIMAEQKELRGMFTNFLKTNPENLQGSAETLYDTFRQQPPKENLLWLRINLLHQTDKDKAFEVFCIMLKSKYVSSLIDFSGSKNPKKDREKLIKIDRNPLIDWLINFNKGETKVISFLKAVKDIPWYLFNQHFSEAREIFRNNPQVIEMFSKAIGTNTQKVLKLDIQRKKGEVKKQQVKVDIVSANFTVLCHLSGVFHNWSEFIKSILPEKLHFFSLSKYARMLLISTFYSDKEKKKKLMGIISNTQKCLLFGFILDAELDSIEVTKQECDELTFICSDEEYQSLLKTLDKLEHKIFTIEKV